jgi:hypothetical protein
MSTRAIDITGKTFGCWVVLARHPERYRGRARWLCRCGCGVERVVLGTSLRRGISKSCRGCGLQKHGHCRKGRQTRVYQAWHSMLQRCCNPANRSYANYGGRGICVCERWRSFVNFLADMGEPPPGLSIDRINNDGNYAPGNCRWATPSQQTQNRRPAKKSKLRIKRNDPEILARLKRLSESLARMGMRP